MVSFQGIEKFKPHLFQILIQVASAGMFIITRMVLTDGMNHFVFVTYRQVIGTLAIAPFAYLLEKKERPPLTWAVLFQIFFLGTGIAVAQNIYIPGLYYTSSTFCAAAFNLIPVLIFIMAIFLGLEKVNIRSFRGQAKVLGTVICVGGAMVMALYKGPVVKFSSTGVTSDQIAYNSKHNIILGFILVFGGVVVASACITFQAPVLKRYPAQLSLIALTSLTGAVESALIGVIFEHKRPNSWAIRWNIELLSVVYAGIICSGLGTFLQIWCISKKGPVFVAIFNPLGTIVTAILEVIIVHVCLRLGSVVGAILIIVGLFATLWGKAKDMETKEAYELGNSIMPPEFPESNNSIMRIIDVTKEDTNLTKQESRL